MPVTRQGANDAMTPESIQAVIDRAIQRNSTHTQDDASHNSGGGLRRLVQPAHVYSYTDFMKCQPLNFKGTKGIVGLSQWLKKMESVFHIIGCAIDNQVKFATCTLLGAALTWWNGYNLRVRGNDVVAYTQCFKELALMCTKFLIDETKKVNKYISGLPDNIHGNVIRLILELYLCAPSAITTTLGNVHLNVETAYGHATNDCRKNCPKLKNHGNSNGNGTAQGRAYALGGRDASPDSDVITGTFLLNNHYATILFDTGADRSFVSATFSALINITPTMLESHYDIELANGKIIGVNTIIRGYTLNFIYHPFNINLMPVPLGSFDVIIGMDWLTKYHGVIICDEKIGRVPFGREMLIFQSNGNNQRKESRRIVISCTKVQEYLSKGYDVFLAHITTKEAKDKSRREAT
ncbi:putative reverse transcriptase domain-containing protein [Tanacetum coccineum]